MQRAMPRWLFHMTLGADKSGWNGSECLCILLPMSNGFVDKTINVSVRLGHDCLPQTLGRENCRIVASVQDVFIGA